MNLLYHGLKIWSRKKCNLKELLCLLLLLIRKRCGACGRLLNAMGLSWPVTRPERKLLQPSRRSNMRLSRNFTLDELACKCGKCDTTVEEINSNLVYQLQKLRDSFGLPIKIASGYRCPEHNKAIGGAPNSQHMRGTAVDICTRHLRGEQRYQLIQLIFRLSTFNGVGIGGGRLHVDVRAGTPVMWFY